MAEYRVPPLNGTKHHPLSEHAWGILEALSAKSVPRHMINPGVRNRLYAEGLVDFTEKRCFITEAGRAKLGERDDG